MRVWRTYKTTSDDEIVVWKKIILRYAIAKLLIDPCEKYRLANFQEISMYLTKQY